MMQLVFLCSAVSLTQASGSSSDLSRHSTSSSPLAATLMGVNAHTAAIPGVIDQLRSAGFSWIRNDVMWEPMEKKPGVYDLKSWDYTMDRIRANGMGIIAITNPRNSLYQNDGTSVHTAQGLVAMGRWVAALARRYSDDTQVWWEITNEPNSDSFYKNATLYAELVATIASAVHAARPNATVAGPASANIGLDTGWLLQVFEAGSLHHLDVVTVHPYRSDGPEPVAVDLTVLMDRVAEYAPPHKTPMPVANGEWGYGAAVVGSLAEQARLFVRQQLITSSMTGQPSIWYEACGPDVGEGRMGIMNCTSGGPPFAPFPAFEAARVLHKVLRNDQQPSGSINSRDGKLTGSWMPVDVSRGFRFVRRVPIFQSSNLDTSDDWVLLYHSIEGDVLLVVWTSSEFEHILRIPGVEEGICFHQTGMLGERMRTLCHDSRGLHANVTTAPKYLLKVR